MNSGDQDLLVPYLSTQAWIETLNVTIAQPWRPWFLDGQVAGFVLFYWYSFHELKAIYLITLLKYHFFFFFFFPGVFI